MVVEAEYQLKLKRQAEAAAEKAAKVTRLREKMQKCLPPHCEEVYAVSGDTWKEQFVSVCEATVPEGDKPLIQCAQAIWNTTGNVPHRTFSPAFPSFGLSNDRSQCFGRDRVDSLPAAEKACVLNSPLLAAAARDAILTVH